EGRGAHVADDGEEEEAGDRDGDGDEPAEPGADPPPPLRRHDPVDEIDAVLDEEPREDAEEDDVDGERGGEVFPERGAAQEVRDAAERVGEGGEESTQHSAPGTQQRWNWAFRI